MIASLSPKEKVGKNISLLIAGAAAALMVGIPLARELVALYSWKFVFLGLIFIMLLSLTYFIFYLPKGTHQKEVNLKFELKLLKEKKVLLVLNGVNLRSWLFFYLFNSYRFLNTYL